MKRLREECPNIPVEALVEAPERRTLFLVQVKPPPRICKSADKRVESKGFQFIVITELIDNRHNNELLKSKVVTFLVLKRTQ